jgi:Putative ER transporter, 6TM, N-terminal
MFGVFLGFGAMIFAFARAYSPQLILFSIFGTITLDIFCVSGYLYLSMPLIVLPQSIGPLYPFANYKILNSLLIASTSYIAIAIVCCFVFFPETVNHAYLGLVSTILDKVKAMLASQDSLLSPMPGDFGPGCPKLKGLAGTRVAVMTMYQNREYQLTISIRWCSQPSPSVTGLKIYLQSEFSIGRWNGDDLFGLADPLLAVVARISTR